MLRKKHEGRVIWRMAEWDQDLQAWQVSAMRWIQDGRVSDQDMRRHGFHPSPNHDCFLNPRWRGRIVWYGNLVAHHPSYTGKIQIIIDDSLCPP